MIAADTLLLLLHGPRQPPPPPAFHLDIVNPDTLGSFDVSIGGVKRTIQIDAEQTGEIARHVWADHVIGREMALDPIARNSYISIDPGTGALTTVIAGRVVYRGGPDPELAAVMRGERCRRR